MKVHVVHPVTVTWIAEWKKKPDGVDAQLLAHRSRIGGLPEPVHVPSRRSRDLRGRLAARRQRVWTRAKLMSVVRGLLRQPRVQLSARSLTSARAWRGLRALPLSPSLGEIVAASDSTVAATTAALKALDGELTSRAQADQRVARLQTIAGVGQVSAQNLVAAVDRIERFPTAKKLVSYSELVPSVRASGDRVVYGRITQQGRSERRVWVQAAPAVLAVKKEKGTLKIKERGSRDTSSSGRAGHDRVALEARNENRAPLWSSLVCRRARMGDWMSAWICGRIARHSSTGPNRPKDSTDLIARSNATQAISLEWVK